MTPTEAYKYIKRIIECWVEFSTQHPRFIEALKTLTTYHDNDPIFIKMKDGDIYKCSTLSDFANLSKTIQFEDIEKVTR